MVHEQPLPHANPHLRRGPIRVVELEARAVRGTNAFQSAGHDNLAGPSAERHRRPVTIRRELQSYSRQPDEGGAENKGSTRCRASCGGPQ